MALPCSGQISFSMVANEIGVPLSYVSLRSMSSIAGKSASDAISEFYCYIGRYAKTLYSVMWDVANGNPCGKTYTTINVWTDKSTLAASTYVFSSSSGSQKYSVNTGAWLSEDLINWRYYDADASVLTSNTIICATSRSISIDLNIFAGTSTLTAFKNGVSYLSRNTTGSSSGSINVGDTFYGRITRSSLTTVDLEIYSTTRGSLYAVYDSSSTLTSSTFTLQSGEDIYMYGAIQSSCLVAGTLITLQDGTKVPVEALNIGDVLKSVQIEGLEDTNDVVELKKWKDENIVLQETYSRIIEISKEEVPITLSFNNDLLKGSSKHVQLIKRDGEWKFLRFGEIKVGDIFITENQEEVEIKDIKVEIASTEVYRIVLEVPTHTYYANGILTHNIK